jgi:hypothetical protein
VGAEQDLDADGNVVLPEQQKMLAEAFVAFALKVESLIIFLFNFRAKKGPSTGNQIINDWLVW